jgi:hypothetical protein
MAQGVGPEFKLQYRKKKKRHTALMSSLRPCDNRTQQCTESQQTISLKVSRLDYLLITLFFHPSGSSL